VHEGSRDLGVGAGDKKARHKRYSSLNNNPGGKKEELSTHGGHGLGKVAKKNAELVLPTQRDKVIRGAELKEIEWQKCGEKKAYLFNHKSNRGQAKMQPEKSANDLSPWLK